MEEYYKLLDAVEQYYGAGSDQWVQIAQYGLNADNAATILRQTPGVSTTVSNSGRILSYTVDNTVSLATQNAGSIINSNAQLPALSRTSTVSVPSNMVVDSTGKVVAESGLKTVSSGSKVAATMGKVAIGVAATSAALQLGAAIDKTLYNINPQFWDAHNMASLNPETWDELISSQTGKNLFNMIFGINKDNNSTQAYLDQDVLAYVAAYMASQGAFSTGDYTDTITDNEKTGIGFTNTTSVIETSLLDLTITRNGNEFSFLPAAGSFRTALVAPKNVNFMAPIFASSAPFSVQGYYNGSKFGTPDSADGPYRVNGKTLYMRVGMNATKSDVYTGNLNIIDEPYSTSSQIERFQRGIAYILVYGYQSGGAAVPGVTPQEGATLPTGITPDMSISDVLAYLQSTYPNLFNNAITNDVVQSDGSIQRYTYVPVPIPDGLTYDEVLEPIGGDDQNQQNKVVTPNVPQNVIDTLLELITATNPDNPTETPTEIPDEDIPDTGDGDTPSIIIPPGSAQALYSIYNPSQAELNSFGSWLWSSDFVDQLLKIFNDPMQAIIGLHKVFATPSVSGTGTIKVGYLNSGVSSNIVGNQYTAVDCGTINLYEYFGNALDYINTDIYLYLPFVGIVPVNTDDVMRGAINVSYKVDVLTGACLCSVNVTRDMHGGQLYTYSGNCAVQYPLSSGSYMGIVSGLLSIAGSVAGTIATGGAALPFALGTGASAINSLRTHVEHSGNIGGNAGAMGIKTPYFIIRRPQTATANNFKSFNGQSQNKYVTLSSCSDYVRVKYVNLENITGATGEELTLIENELTKGVLI